MSVEGITSAFQTGFAQGAHAASAAEGAKGVFMGHTVSASATSPASLLADAAEELGFSVDRTKDYEISQRKQRETGDAGRKLLERYQAMMQQTGKGESLNNLVESFKKLADREAMQKALGEAFPDPTDAWAALEAAKEAFDADPSVTNDQKAALAALTKDFLAENGEAVRLGLQGALAGADYPELGGTDSTRDFYRQTVGEFSSVNEVFAEIQQKYGANFDKAMDFLFAAISNDIGCEEPSMEKTHLENVHQKLGIVRLTQSAYRLCADMLGRWQDVHGMHSPDLTPMKLLGDVIDLRGRSYVGQGLVDAICRKAAPPDIEHEVIFLQELLSTVRKFPVVLFDDDQGRMKVMDAVQSAVDDAINREDEYLASLEEE